MSAAAVEAPPAVEAKPPRVPSGVTWKDKKEAAVLRVKLKIGQEAMDAIKADWSVLDAGNGKKDQEKGNEIIIALCNLSLSQIEILSMLGCGSERISKMRLRIAQGDEYVSRSRKPPSHAFKEPTLKYLFDYMDQLETEVSVICQHHCNKFVVEQGVTWKILHERYQEGYSTLTPAMKEVIEFMKYSTFTQYIHHKNPGLSLSRPKQDVCLICAASKAKETSSSSGRAGVTESTDGPPPKTASQKRKVAEIAEDKDGSDSEDDVVENAAASVPVEEVPTIDKNMETNTASAGSTRAVSTSVATQIRALVVPKVSSKK